MYIVEYIMSLNWLCFGEVDTDWTLSLLNLEFPTIVFFLTSECSVYSFVFGRSSALLQKKKPEKNSQLADSQLGG